MTADLDRCQALEMLGYTRTPGAVPRARGATRRLLPPTPVRGVHRYTRTGKRRSAFLARCVAREHVRMLPYGRHGHVFHLYARPLYAAIGEEDNRNRRPAEWDAVIRKLMTVDFVLAHPTARFLATEEEKVALLRERLIPSVVWPHRSYAPRRPSGRDDDSLLRRQDAVVPGRRG